MPAMLTTAIVHELNDLFRSIDGRRAGLRQDEILSVEMLRLVFPDLHRFSLHYLLGERPVAVGAEEAHFAVALRLVMLMSRRLPMFATKTPLHMKYLSGT